VTGWLASGGPVPGTPGGGLRLNTALITALLIGIPSVLVAVGSYWLSLRARREQGEAQQQLVDAQAFSRAREVYESAIAELRQQLAELRQENRDLRARTPRSRHRP